MKTKGLRAVELSFIILFIVFLVWLLSGCIAHSIIEITNNSPWTVCIVVDGYNWGESQPDEIAELLLESGEHVLEAYGHDDAGLLHVWYLEFRSYPFGTTKIDLYTGE